MSDPQPTFAERMVNRMADGLDRKRTGRRSFLAGLAVSGSALALEPWGFLVRDAAAYDVVCGAENECGDGWTAFCCTVGGTNSCPPGSFPAGWWKADNSGFCCGSARYYIDCNASCGSNWKCRCASGTCDRRRVACNQFRYGQCHLEIGCYGPVVCRVVTCQPPWQWDSSCTTTSRTDNRTATHSAPCNTKDCLSDVDRLWKQLGGESGVLGAKQSGETAAPPKGYRTFFAGGSIYRNQSEVHEVHGAISDLYVSTGSHLGQLGYPTANTRTGRDGKARYSTFDNGVIYYRPGIGTFEMHGGIHAKWKQIGGETSAVRYPTSSSTRGADGFSWYNTFDFGMIMFRFMRGTYEVHGAIYDKWVEIGGERGRIGLPRTDTRTAANGDRYNEFDGGWVAYSPVTKASWVTYR